MITPILERLILQGKARYNVHNHNFASYGKLVVPNKNMIVITDIIYYPFVNVNKLSDTWRDVMAYYNEIQLVLESENNKSVYNFKNALEVTVLRDMPANPLNTNFGTGDVFIQPKPPIILNTFLTNLQDIKIRVTRNLSYKNGLQPPNGTITTAPVAQNSNEDIYPRGLLGQVTINSINSGTDNKPNPASKGAFQYLPYGTEDSTVINNFNATPQYVQGVHNRDSPTLRGSALETEMQFQNDSAANQAFPLIQLGYVQIKDLKAIEELNNKSIFEV